MPFSPLGRGFLTGTIDHTTSFAPGDFRNQVPRFAPAARQANLTLVERLTPLAREKGVTLAQLALGWLLSRKPWIVPIPGTKRLERLEENLGSVQIAWTAEELGRVDAALATVEVTGARYPAHLAARVGK